jgi:HAD superfamily 5'-nucleotidase-like hydrolase
MTPGLPRPVQQFSSEFRATPAHHPGGAPRPARIFVNRNLRMRSIGAVGFDLDYTLAHYRYRELDDLAFRLTQRKLVEKRGHPREILDVPFDPEFVVRGLVIDRRRGNILKMDYHNYVVRAFHGRKSLTSAERKRIYRMRRVRTSAAAYVSVDTLFHLPEVYLYLSLVDFYEERGRKPDYGALYDDVRAMIDEAHGDGSIKSEIQADPGRFVSPDPRLGPFLDSLRRAGKRVFLLTNSEYYYTDVLLSYLLGGTRSWRTYFDLVAVDARKPSFFLRRSRPQPVPIDAPGAPVWSGGDVWNFEKNLGFAGDGILYWGDHTYGDILRSKKSVGWRTAMIIPELETELLTTERISSQLARLDDAVKQRDRLSHEEQMARAELLRLEALLERSGGSADEVRQQLARKVADLRERRAGLEAEAARQHELVVKLDDAASGSYNRHWGMLFREANEITRFGHQVRDFACIYTSRVSNFLHYPMDTYFRAPVDRLPHEL